MGILLYPYTGTCAQIARDNLASCSIFFFFLLFSRKSNYINTQASATCSARTYLRRSSSPRIAMCGELVLQDRRRTLKYVLFCIIYLHVSVMSSTACFAKIPTRAHPSARGALYRLLSSGHTQETVESRRRHTFLVYKYAVSDGFMRFVYYIMCYYILVKSF